MGDVDPLSLSEAVEYAELGAELQRAYAHWNSLPYLARRGEQAYERWFRLASRFNHFRDQKAQR